MLVASSLTPLPNDSHLWFKPSCLKSTDPVYLPWTPFSGCVPPVPRRPSLAPWGTAWGLMQGLVLSNDPDYTLIIDTCLCPLADPLCLHLHSSHHQGEVLVCPQVSLWTGA